MTLSRILLVLGIVLAASRADCLALRASAGCGENGAQARSVSMSEQSSIAARRAELE